MKNSNDPKRITNKMFLRIARRRLRHKLEKIFVQIGRSKFTVVVAVQRTDDNAFVTKLQQTLHDKFFLIESR